MGEVGIQLTPEHIVAQLELAVSDSVIRVEADRAGAVTRDETIYFLTDELAASATDEFLDEHGESTSESIAFLSEAGERIRALWGDIREWAGSKFDSAQDKLQELGKKVIDLAKKVGRSAADLIASLQRRIMGWLVANSVLTDVRFGPDGHTSVLAPKEVKQTASWKVSPSLGTLDLTGVVSLLSGMLEMEIGVEVTYEIKP